MRGVGKLMLRGTLGAYFVGHGLQKLTGWFGGGGPDGTGAFFESAGIRPGREQALLAGAAETAGGTLLGLGLLTPLAASLLAGVMTNAIRHVHAGNGVWNSNGGVELPALVLASLAALTESTPGPLSLDAKLHTTVGGPGILLLALGGGAAGGILASELGSRLAPPPRPAEGLIRSDEPVATAS